MWGFFVLGPVLADTIEPAVVKAFENIPILNSIFEGPASNLSLFNASLVLAIMILPFVTAIARDVFNTVPPVLKEAAYGLGCTTWEVVRRVVFPYTRVGVIGGIMLGLGRALGETMAVTFVIGNAFQMPSSLFSPGNSIASALANEFNEAGGLQKSALIELGLILFLITTVVLALSKLLLLRMQAGEGKKT